MSRIQKLLLFFSLISFIIATINYYLLNILLSYIAFVLHSACLLIFIFFTQRKMKVSSHLTTQELTQQLSFARHELQVLTEKNKELVSKNQQLMEQLDTLINNTTPACEELADSLLPPLPPNEPVREPIELVRLVQEIIRELQPFADNAGLILRLSAATDPLYIKASSSRMRILFRNIIDNSIKYMRRKGNLIITLSIVGDDIFIVLKDDGRGLSSEETHHIFELNYQGSNRISGNGLGLTQAKAIVESYGGTIYGKSSPNLGMGIYIQIPLS